MSPDTSPPLIGLYWKETGGVYAGIASGFGAEPDAYLILHPGRPAMPLLWQAAVEWATALGEGWRLPTRGESALLFAHLHAHFTSDWYWTGVRDSTHLALVQSFETGSQLNCPTRWEHGNACAVRRISLRRFFPVTPAPASQTSAQAAAPEEVAL